MVNIILEISILQESMTKKWIVRNKFYRALKIEPQDKCVVLLFITCNEFVI